MSACSLRSSSRNDDHFVVMIDNRFLVILTYSDTGRLTCVALNDGSMGVYGAGGDGTETLPRVLWVKPSNGATKGIELFDLNLDGVFIHLWKEIRNGNLL